MGDRKNDLGTIENSVVGRPMRRRLEYRMTTPRSEEIKSGGGHSNEMSG